MAQAIKEIVSLIESMAPQHAAESWDQVGLQLGGLNDQADRVMVALEVTEAVLEEAIDKDIQLIIVHHPFIFKPLKKIRRDDPRGKLIYKAIENNIAIYSVHTNIDVVEEGLNQQIALKFDLEDIQILEVTGKKQYYKLAVFVPAAYEEKVAAAMAQAGAGHIGNYSHCSFRSEGTGTFKPLEGASPFIGSENQLEAVKEVKIETIVDGGQLKAVVDAMITAHPYEEVAYDLYPLIKETPQWGIGRIGKLKEHVSLNLFVETVKSQLNIPGVRVIGDVNSLIERVCIVNGSGAEYIKAAADAGCQCLITGDVKYHDAQMALELGINIIDAGHYETEAFFVEWMTDYLKEKIALHQLKVKVFPSQTYINPFQWL